MNALTLVITAAFLAMPLGAWALWKALDRSIERDIRAAEAHTQESYVEAVHG